MLKIYVDDKFFGFTPRDDQTDLIFKQNADILYVYQVTDGEYITVFTTNKPYILVQE